MRVTVKRYEALTGGELRAWDTIVSQNRSLSSPYFRHEFVREVSRIREDVWVSVIEDRDELVGFFPYQRSEGGRGVPVGGRLSDFHGIIAAPQASIDLPTLLRESHLTSWRFSHVPAKQAQFYPYRYCSEISPYLDLRDGFKGYIASLPRRGLRELKKRLRRRRQIEREIGPIRFVADVQDPSALETLLRWKTTQFSKTSSTNPLSFFWIVRLLHELNRVRDEDFRGLTSAVYIGDELAAIHMGLRSKAVLHYWFISYNPKFARYSPGTVLMLEIASNAEKHGIERIDLGKGMTRFKRDSMTSGDEVLEGCVDTRQLIFFARRRWWSVKNWLKQFPMGVKATNMVKNVAPQIGMKEFE